MKKSVLPVQAVFALSRNYAIGSVVLARFFCASALSLARYGFRFNPRLAHFALCAKGSGAITSFPTAYLRLSRSPQRLILLATCLGITLIFSGCGSADNPAEKGSPSAAQPSTATPPTPSTNAPKIFQVKGILKEIDLAKRKLKILHDEIPDYMPRMTMVFEVRDQSDFSRLKMGEQVAFKMVATDDDGWIEQVTPTGADVSTKGHPAGPTNQIGSMKLVRNVLPLFPGDVVPDQTFTNEFGKTVKLSDYKGKTVALTFIFTTCPFPTFCPKMSVAFRDAYKALSNPGGMTGDWHLFSITIDPERDTPAALLQYGTNYGYDSQYWSFLTGQLDDIEAFGRQFGLGFGREEGALNHNLRTVVIGPTGKLHKTLVGNEWSVDELTEAMKAAAKK